MSLTVPPLAADVPRTLADDQPLTTGWVNAALSKLCSLGLPKIADWIMADPEVCERPAVEEMIRDVLDCTGEDLGYRHTDGETLPRDVTRRDRTRFELLALWANDPRYDDPDPPHLAAVS